MSYLGLDIGSTTTKGVVLNSQGEITNSLIIPTGSAPVSSGNRVIAELSKDAEINRLVVTGYGRGLFETADKKITEITCHAIGINHLYPDAKGVIDIGGQDSKAIHLGNGGSVHDFAMNDKCAAGTGSFLDNIAHKFCIEYDTMLELYEQSDRRININSTCVVFAESEIIGLLAKGEKMPDIFKGVLRAIAMRVGRLYSQVKLPYDAELYFSGGVAKNSAMRLALEEELGVKLIVSPYAQHMGALGAAVSAMKQ